MPGRQIDNDLAADDTGLVRPLFFLLMLGLVLSAWPLTGEGLGLTTDETRYLASLPRLKVMVDEDFSPLSRWNPQLNVYEGISVDLFEQAAQALGLKLEFVREVGLPFNEKLKRIASGSIDVLMSVSITEERSKSGLFTDPYFKTYYVAVGVKDSHPVLQTPADLASYRFAAVEGSAIVPYVKTKIPADHLVLRPNPKDPYEEVRAHRVDFALQNQLAFEEDRFNLELFDFDVALALTEFPRPYAFYFSKTPDRPRLVALVNRFLAQADLKPLQDRYQRGSEALVLKYTQQKHRQDLLVIVTGASTLAMLLLVGLLWNARRLQASEARFRALAEASFGAVAIHERGKILECNPRLSEMTGFTRDELVGIDGLRLIAPESRALVQKNLASGDSTTYEIIGLRKDGSRFPVGVRGKNIPYQGRPVRVTEFFDLTEQRRAEEETRRSKLQYDELVAKLPVGVYVLRTGPDDQIRFDYVSPPMAAMLGLSADRIHQDYSSVLTVIHPDDRDHFDAVNRERIGARKNFEWVGRFRHGEVDRWVRISSMPAPQGDGSVLWHGLLVDITASKAAEQRIEGLLQEKELVLKEVHHRIKNNMNSIAGLLTLQAASLTSSGAVAALEDAKARVLSMMVLYDKLYQGELWGGSVSLQTYLPALVHEVVENFPNAASIEVQTRCDDLEVEAPALSSLGILVNELLTNAMKYAFVGRTAGTLLVTATREGGHIVITVEDNGRGLPSGFDPSKSTGFGFTLVEMLSAHLKGKLTVEPAEGTRFVLRLPG